MPLVDGLVIVSGFLFKSKIPYAFAFSVPSCSWFVTVTGLNIRTLDGAPVLLYMARLVKISPPGQVIVCVGVVGDVPLPIKFTRFDVFRV